jgi:hypothetical protein
MTEETASAKKPKKEHHQHQAMRTKAITKIRKHSDAGARLEEFLKDEVENFEAMYADAMTVVASAPTMTQAQLLENIRKVFNELRLAIDDRKGDIPEIIDLVAHGKVPKDQKPGSAGAGEESKG